MLATNKLKYILSFALIPLLFSCNQVQKAEAQNPSPIQKKQELLIRKTLINSTDTLQEELINNYQLFS